VTVHATLFVRLAAAQTEALSAAVERFEVFLGLPDALSAVPVG